MTAIHAGWATGCLEPWPEVYRFHRYCIPATFREIWLFLGKNRANCGAVVQTYGENAPGPSGDARSPDLSFVLIDDCTPARDAEWKRQNREFGARGAARAPNAELLMPKVPHAGEDHGDAQPVGSFDDGVVAHRASGLNHSGGSGLCDGLQAVGEGKEGV
jgi:hypothetical protein